MSSPLLYSQQGAVVTITLNRPEKLNALSRATVEALFDAWKRFEGDPAAQVAILTGAGNKSFCVGRDLNEPAEGPFTLESLPILDVSVTVTKPVIAAVNGLALGGGFLLAQMCDLIVAAEHAIFSIPEARLGRGAAWAAPLLKMLPPRAVTELLLTGRPMSSSRLRELGFVNAVTNGSDLMDAATSMALAIAANAPLSVRACRKMVRMAGDPDNEPQSRSAVETMFEHVYLSEDAEEGVRAFREKRAPSWNGR
ncbi:enoyl-CoA hydratase-related protein [Hydrogenophaga sp. BPS33]|uniref:enoyl-CoA hydratase-related protein n=1 Tax=Hydrogenophaga sp. BPS33 TaxID=2651974 RepID=UPI0013200CBC|nr:enoyl-CoA hydratase-related protein [Hydrogenophaga sp. BPS33]QHE87516.1 enoyl-CoA hydratase/isomerase family protein [Hydrogenophaga sp. BPS33]